MDTEHVHQVMPMAASSHLGQSMLTTMLSRDKVARISGILRTWLVWKWRLGGLGTRTALGKRRRVVNPAAIAIGEHVTICEDWSICDLAPGRGMNSPKVRIGDWCTVMDDFQCNAAVSVEIQDHVLIASRVFITDSDHVVEPHGRRTTRNRALVSAPVLIEHDCWLGQNVVVLKGVTIGHHSIVGANAVVTKSIPPYSIVAGVPARRIGSTVSDAYSASAGAARE